MIVLSNWLIEDSCLNKKMYEIWLIFYVIFETHFTSNYDKQKTLYNDNYCLIYNFDKKSTIKKL